MKPRTRPISSLDFPGFSKSRRLSFFRTEFGHVLFDARHEIAIATFYRTSSLSRKLIDQRFSGCHGGRIRGRWLSSSCKNFSPFRHVPKKSVYVPWKQFAWLEQLASVRLVFIVPSFDELQNQSR